MKNILLVLMMMFANSTFVTADERNTAGPVWLMVIHEVEDYAKWRAIFDNALSVRQRAGELSFEIVRHPGYPNNIIAIFQWDTAERARAFVDDPGLRNSMKAAGVISEPIVTFHEDTPSLDGGQSRPVNNSHLYFRNATTALNTTRIR